ncbi:excinuclease ABC subunit C, partial [bacterium]|nr:excinuclease ABC subunit C [bacterium]
MAYPTAQVEQQVKSIPENPGVYRYYNGEGELLYIGKAKNLKKRVSSYFTKNQTDSARIRLMVAKIRNIEFSVVNT